MDELDLAPACGSTAVAGQEGDPMKVVRFDEAESYEPEKDWKRVSLCCEADISVEHFVKPPGHASPRHEHPAAQVIIVLKGKMVIATDDEEEEMNEGDAVYIPGNEPHVLTNPLTETSIGVDIFVPGRSFDFWLKRKQT
jgi:quercetin dioxygenase-like cupin family protein